jgi:hypothetical protein
MKRHVKVKQLEEFDAASANGSDLHRDGYGMGHAGDR